MASKKVKRIRKPDANDGERKLPTDIPEPELHPDLKELVHETITQASPAVDGQGARERLLIQYDNEHQLAKHFEESRKGISKELLDGMKSDGQDKLTAETEREKLTGTRVTQTRVDVDEEKLKKALGSKLWAKVTSPKLDQEKLEALIKVGDVDPNVVASCSNERPIEFIRVNRRTKK